MGLSEYQKNHSVWVIICYIFLDGFLEYETRATPWIIQPSWAVEKGIVTMYHPAVYSIEWLSYLIVIWFIGHVVIWAINKFR